MAANDAEKPLRDPQKPSIAEWSNAQGGLIFGPVASIDLRAAAHIMVLCLKDLIGRSDHSTRVAAGTIKTLFKRTA